MSGYILVADDEPGLRYLYQQVLEALGFETRCAADGEECILMAKSVHKPSLILLDYKMPRLNGLEVLSALEKDPFTRRIPVIMISSEENLKEMIKHHEVKAVLTKPFDMQTLLASVQKALDSLSGFNYQPADGNKEISDWL